MTKVGPVWMSQPYRGRGPHFTSRPSSYKNAISWASQHCFRGPPFVGLQSQMLLSLFTELVSDGIFGLDGCTKPAGGFIPDDLFINRVPEDRLRITLSARGRRDT